MKQTDFSGMKRLALLTALVGGVALVTSTVAIILHYQFTLKARTADLTAVAQGHAEFLEAVAHFNRRHLTRVGGESPAERELARIVVDRYYKSKHSGPFGTVTVAEMVEGRVRVIWSSADGRMSSQADSDSTADWAAAMKMALGGADGTLTSRNHRGRELLAAFQPVPDLQWGVVAHLDKTELRTPFVLTGAAIGVADMIAILLGVWLFRRTVDPVMQRVLESEERYRKVAEMSVAGISIHNLDMRITFANPALEKMLGYEPGGLIGVHLSQVASREQATIFADNTVRRLRGEGPSRYEATLHRRDGSTLPVIISAAALMDAKRSFMGTLAIVLDITDRKQVEAELVRLKDAAEQANAIKGEFLANVSHELRSPLHVILGFAQQGLRRVETGECERIATYLKRIHESGSLLLHTVNELLDLSKLDAGHMPFVLERADLALIVGTVVDECESLFSERRIKVAFQEPAVPIEAEVDCQKLQQVVRNLLSNAAKFSDAGSLVNVALERQDGGFQVEIRDNGPGIPEAELDAIFAKFTQSSRTKSGAGGTGLGLAICREIVTAHGGQIWAENGPERGAVFKFTIPSAGAAAVASTARSRPTQDVLA